MTLPSVPDRAVAQELVEEADRRCPYSNAVRNNVEVTITVV
ncbi:MAG: OsmC family protein [Candidatus Dormibacteraeota bacterium]|nr:OsmC family protein [Candidatus Dormibacteraeota bacterium]